MNFVAPTDEELDHLRTIPKQVTNARTQWRDKPGHRQRNYVAESEHYRFEIYLRQNTNDPGDFSCGLSVFKPDGTKLTLCRYNGGSHKHGEIYFQCHIHQATYAEIIAGRKPESHAEKTHRYRTLDGAWYCLVHDCDLIGFDRLTPDEPDLFDN